MGAVWVAEHQSLRTQVVVKFMSGELLKSPEATARFSREAAAASQVKSPHVVQTFDHGVTPDGTPYIVMELLEGRDLEHHIRASGKMSPRETVAIVAQLARALSKAHERSIVHRDIKPSNVFLCDAGGGEMFVKLLDFGIAKGPEVGIVGSTTRTGSFIGSPYYMSPEQVVGAKDIDFRSDLWSLGVVAFEALTGKKPFFAETVGALALKIHRDPLPRPSEANPELPAAVDTWFDRACAREPGDRFASAREMADALAVAATGTKITVGVSIDRVPAPLRGPAALAATEQATVPDVSPSGVDARSETGAGVGLASQGIPVHRRGRLVVLGGVAVAAIGVGFIVPRLMSRPVDPRATPSTSAAAASAVTSLAVPAVPASAVLPPLESATAAAVDTSVALAATASAHPGLSNPAVGLGGGKARPHPSATTSTPVAAATTPPTTPTTVKPPPGSDDDIK
jgi:serine/threonine-protein kinase